MGSVAGGLEKIQEGCRGRQEQTPNHVVRATQIRWSPNRKTLSQRHREESPGRERKKKSKIKQTQKAKEKRKRKNKTRNFPEFCHQPNAAGAISNCTTLAQEAGKSQEAWDPGTGSRKSRRFCGLLHHMVSLHFSSKRDSDHTVTSSLPSLRLLSLR